MTFFIIIATILGSILMINLLLSLLTTLIKLFGVVLLCFLLFLACFFLFKEIKQLISIERK